MRVLFGAMESNLALWLLVVLAIAPAARSETLFIGSVARDALDETLEYQPFADYLAERLQGTRFDKVEIVVLPRTDLMVEAFRRGRAHLYIDSPMLASRVAYEADAVPLVRRVRSGYAEYNGITIVRSDSPFQSFADLRGHVFGFESLNSSFGYYFPRSEMLAQGLTFFDIATPDAPVPPNAVGGFITRDDVISIRMLLAGEIDATTLDSRGARKVMKRHEDELRVLHEGVMMPRHVAVRSALLTEEEAALIAEVLVEMDDDPANRELLDEFGGTDRFDHFPDGVDATFQPIFRRLELLDREKSTG